MSTPVRHSSRRRWSLYAPIFLVTLSLFLRVDRLQAAPVVSRDINTYVLFGYDELVWKGGTPATNSGYIVGGNIGVNYAATGGGLSLAFGTSARGIMSVGSQAVADSVRADDSLDVFDVLFANTLNPSFDATVLSPNPATTHGNYPFMGPIIDTGSLPILPFTPGRMLTDTAPNLTVGGAGGVPSPLTLSPGALRDVRFNDDVVVNLGAGIYDMRNLSIGKNVTINVNDATILQIDRRFDPNDDLLFGTNGGYNGLAQLLVGGFGDNPNTERSAAFSHNAEIHAQFFAPNSWLDLGGGNELYGRYWAKRITGDPNNNVYMVVPEPASCLLAAIGLVALLCLRSATIRRGIHGTTS